jgi:hypothetical protein
MRNAVRAYALFHAIRRSAEALLHRKRVRRMREPVKQSTSTARNMRACIGVLSERSSEERLRQASGNARRLRSESNANEWRRTEMGTNHIACFGIWRRGTRRQAERMNRSGITRWHKPHRQGAAFTLAGAGKNEAAFEA